MKRLLPLLLIPLLAGCTDVTIPADALHVTHDDLGGDLWAWSVVEDGFVTFHARFTYDGTEPLIADWQDPLGYWNLTLIGPDGDSIIYDSRPHRHGFYEHMGVHVDEDFVYTWTLDAYDRYEQGGIQEDLESHPVPAGNYTAVVQFLFAYEPDDSFEARLPVTVP